MNERVWPSVSVVIPAYSMQRWPLIRRGVESVRNQSVPVDAVVLAVDDNPELLAAAESEWGERAGVTVRVIASRPPEGRVAGSRDGAARGFGAGVTRNAGAASVESEIVAFIDDDAWAEPDWLEQLLPLYRDPAVVAVGGASLPDYETGRPGWFPPNFDWIFGCSYSGLPSTTAPLRRLLGPSMTVRRDAFAAVGGFRVEPHVRAGEGDRAILALDDMSLSLLLEARYGVGSMYYEPRAVVHHYVASERVTWRYFCRRAYLVNREKARLFDELGSAASLGAERAFVARVVSRQALAEARRALAGEPAGLLSLGAMLAGTALAGAGYLHGYAEKLLPASR